MQMVMPQRGMLTKILLCSMLMTPSLISLRITSSTAALDGVQMRIRCLVNFLAVLYGCPGREDGVQLERVM